MSQGAATAAGTGTTWEANGRSATRRSREQDEAAARIAVGCTLAEPVCLAIHRQRGAHSDDDRRGHRMGECWCFIDQHGSGNNRVPRQAPANRELLPARFCACASASAVQDCGDSSCRDSPGKIHRLLSNGRPRLPRTLCRQPRRACASLF